MEIDNEIVIVDTTNDIVYNVLRLVELHRAYKFMLEYDGMGSSYKDYCVDSLVREIVKVESILRKHKRDNDEIQDPEK